MFKNKNLLFSVGARNSSLSRAQVLEVLKELHCFYPEISFDMTWVETAGDRDLQTSLRTLEKTDFFTREIDALQLAGKCRVGVHSAKDLPEPLPKGLKLIALTKGVSPEDALVFREKENLDTLPLKSLIGTSSIRREETIYFLRSDLICIDIRGTIERRLALLDEKKVDGVVVAEAALIRLGLTQRNRIKLSGPISPLQGKLAIIALEEDFEMERFFSVIDARDL